MGVSSAIPDTPARRLRDALEPLAAQGFYSAREALEALGLSFIPGYVWSRAAALGEPSPSVVVAAFGVFEPTFLAEAYTLGRATAARSDVLAARAEGATRPLQEILGDDADVGALAEVLLGALDGVAGTARPLFSGLRETPLPPTPHGRLWRAADLVREHRGDGHLAACIAAGLDPVAMNVMTELWVGYPLGAYTPTRGHSSEAIDAAVAGLRRRGLDRRRRVVAGGSGRPPRHRGGHRRLAGRTDGRPRWPARVGGDHGVGFLDQGGGGRGLQGRRAQAGRRIEPFRPRSGPRG